MRHTNTHTHTHTHHKALFTPSQTMMWTFLFIPALLPVPPDNHPVWNLSHRFSLSTTSHDNLFFTLSTAPPPPSSSDSSPYSYLNHFPPSPSPVLHFTNLAATSSQMNHPRISLCPSLLHSHSHFHPPTPPSLLPSPHHTPLSDSACLLHLPSSTPSSLPYPPPSLLPPPVHGRTRRLVGGHIIPSEAVPSVHLLSRLRAAPIWPWVHRVTALFHSRIMQILIPSRSHLRLAGHEIRKVFTANKSSEPPVEERGRQQGYEGLGRTWKKGELGCRWSQCGYEGGESDMRCVCVCGTNHKRTTGGGEGGAFV